IGYMKLPEVRAGSYRLSRLLCVLALAGLTACAPPVDPPVAIAKSQQAREQGKFPEAIIELKNLLQAYPDHTEAHFLLGTAYLESGAAERAQEELQAALDRGFDPKQVLPELGKALVVREKYKEALEATDPGRVAGAQNSPEVLNIRSIAQLAL